MPLGDESPASFAQLFLPQSRRCDATVGGGHIAQGLLLAMSDDVRFWPHCSLRPNARRIGKAIRGHWSIENGLHWVLDVVFREDARRLYDRTVAENTALLNRLAVSVLRGDPSKGSLKVKRKRAGRNIRYLAQLLGFPSN